MAPWLQKNTTQRAKDRKMIEKICYFILKCDHCQKETANFKNHEEARKSHWAIRRDRKGCYCPTCANYYRIGVPYDKQKEYFKR